MRRSTTRRRRSARHPAIPVRNSQDREDKGHAEKWRVGIDNAFAFVYDIDRLIMYVAVTVPFISGGDYEVFFLSLLMNDSQKRMYG